MKALGAEIRHDVTAINNLQAGLHPRVEAGVAGLFVSRRGAARPAPLVLRDPVLPADTPTPSDMLTPPDRPPDTTSGTPPENPSERAAWIARHLEADCFHFARPGPGPRRG